jgi:hypothetical protein
VIIFGVKGYARLLAIVTLVCGRCGNPAAQRIVQHLRKFTLFFIPLFPVSSSRSMTCTFCGQSTRLPKADAEQLVSSGTATGAPGTPAPNSQPRAQ